MTDKITRGSGCVFKDLGIEKPDQDEAYEMPQEIWMSTSEISDYPTNSINVERPIGFEDTMTRYVREDTHTYIEGQAVDVEALKKTTSDPLYVTGDSFNVGQVIGWNKCLDELNQRGMLRNGWQPDNEPDNTGLDDGPSLTKQQIMFWKKPLMIKAHNEGLSARAIGRVFDVSHDTAATIVKHLPPAPKGEA